ncbi:DUF6443 domain-containing protein [uncultured Psychroserpens sp.]|uniref:DUF6443 domain-containing protein n=1 Tax=uncultured Psychroserpens sp. TaxID=255436 RepID=UPI00261E06B5|nr:DUF6443 domain-containing protein [uncultured Psychroserpens sp.]
MLEHKNIKHRKNSILTLVAMLAFSFYGFSQFIAGPTTVVETSTHTYTYDSGNLITYQKWTVTGGTKLSYGLLSGTTYYVTIKWGTTGVGNIKMQQRKTVLAELDVNITTATYCADTNLTNTNYVHTITPRVAVSNHAAFDQLDSSQKLESVTYFDGLGRAVQSVAIRAGASCEDIIAHAEYDAYGRAKQEFLPFAQENNGGAFKTNAENTTDSFYNTTKYENTLNPYTEKAFEASPLNRVLKQAAPGNDWAMGGGHEIEMDYQTNENSEVRRFEVTLAYNSAHKIYNTTLTLNGMYNEGELYKSITRDENHTGTSKNHTVEEFTDAEGRLILKRTFNDIDVNNDGTISGTNESAVKHDTYYVYDRHGNLSFVLPPLMLTDTGVLTDVTNAMDGLGYQYKYDDKNRLVEKKVPGKGWEYIVYNKLDLPIMTQDEILDQQGKWLFTKYDAFGRVAYTGIKNSTGSRTYFQNLANDYALATQYEVKVSSGTGYSNTYYTSTAIPTSSDEIHTISYYDDYNFDLAGGVSETAYGITPITNVKGLATGTKVKVLDTNDWITTVSYYDSKAQPLYIYSHNTYLETTDKVKSNIEFDGRVTETTTTHTRTGHSAVYTVDTFDYDSQNRLLSHHNKITSTFMPEEVITEHSYDELGQLESKGVGGDISQSRLQTIDYTYTVRGWLKSINDVDNLGHDLFGFELNYNGDIEGSGGGNPLYNGNISQIKWKTENDNIKRGYSFKYDALNRLTTAYSRKQSTLSAVDQYSMWTKYDKNGNLTRLHRNGHTNSGATTFGAMDDLNYTYETNSNQLKKVEDMGNDTYGFVDGSNTTTEYTYDVNGNMLTDANKGISSNITYNHLNLPTQVTLSGGNIQYIYDATGIKQKKIVSTGGNTEYAGGYIYENGVLKFFSHPEGFVEKNGASYDYVYQYKDHLGNIRLNYKDISTASTPNLEIQEENNYYPFGLKHKGYNGNVVSDHNYGFGGKEEQNELDLDWIDITARNYDPSLGRWMNLDPLAEIMRRHSPYSYGFNNPLRYVDPDGMAPDDLVLEGKQKAINQFEKLTNEELGGQFVHVDGNGNVTLSATDKEYAAFTDEQKGLYDVLKKSVDAKGVVTVNIVMNDVDTRIGGTETKTIDIGDISEIKDGKALTKKTLIGHEFEEQFEYQLGSKGKPLNKFDAHSAGEAVESTINGGYERLPNDPSDDNFRQERIPKSAKTRGVTSSQGNINHPSKKAISGTYTYKFTKNGKTITATITYKYGNVTSNEEN